MLTQIQKLKVSKLWEVCKTCLIGERRSLLIYFWFYPNTQVIDVNELVVRLAVDTSRNVCRRLVTLLAPFYHPKSQTEIVFQRCLRLVIVRLRVKNAFGAVEKLRHPFLPRRTIEWRLGSSTSIFTTVLESSK